MESAVDHGLHLLLEVATLAEELPDVEDFLAGVAERLAKLVLAERVVFHVYNPNRRALIAHRAGGAGDSFSSDLPCDQEASDLLSQVVFAGRVYRGMLDLGSLEFRPYAHLARLWPETGTSVLIVPWRAGSERLGAVVAHGSDRPEGFSEENAIVLTAGGHAAGMAWQRKRAERRLAERAEELESLERTKNSFLMLASHELRTPLTVLNGYVSMLADDNWPPERLAGVLPILQHALDRMNILVDQLMEATRLSEGRIRLRKQEADLRTVVQNAVGRIIPRWRREGDFRLQLPADPVVTAVDVIRLETVVENLIDNAFKYSNAGDCVDCCLLTRPGEASLVVQDEGLGMSDEELAGLFKRFGRMVNARNSHIGGTGLGLFLSREIARMHGGEINAERAEGGGSRFELRLPLEPADRRRADAERERRRKG